MYCIYIPKREVDIKSLLNSYDMKVNFIKGIDKRTINIDELINDFSSNPTSNSINSASEDSHLKIFIPNGNDLSSGQARI